MELQERSEQNPVVASPESAGARRVGERKDAQRVRGSDLNVGYVGQLEGLVNGFHGGKEVCDEDLVSGVVNLVADGDVADGGLGVVWEHVG